MDKSETPRALGRLAASAYRVLGELWEEVAWNITGFLNQSPLKRKNQGWVSLYLQRAKRALRSLEGECELSTVGRQSWDRLVAVFRWETRRVEETCLGAGKPGRGTCLGKGLPFQSW